MTMKKQMDNETQEIRDNLYYQGKSQRWLEKKIYKTEMKFWAVLGRRGCREKTAISKQLFEVVFSTFVGIFFLFSFSENIFVCALKSYMI